jgi:hypothetical protein
VIDAAAALDAIDGVDADGTMAAAAHPRRPPRRQSAGERPLVVDLMIPRPSADRLCSSRWSTSPRCCSRSTMSRSGEQAPSRRRRPGSSTQRSTAEPRRERHRG